MRTNSRIVAGCIVCGARTCEAVCSAAEVAGQFQYISEFHQRRLATETWGAPSDNALTDRSEFTQDYTTDIVRHRLCGLVYRTPRPPEQAITQAYREDHYGEKRLDPLFTAQFALYRSKAQLLRNWLPQGHTSLGGAP